MKVTMKTTSKRTLVQMIAPLALAPLTMGLGTIGLGAMGFSAMAQAEGLKDALAAAYASNPDLEGQRAVLRATDEGMARARAGFLPNVAGSASITRQNVQDENGSTLTEFNSTNKSYQMRADQSVFRGFRDINSRREAKSLVKAGRAQLLSVEQDVLLQAVTAYMDVLRDEAVLELNTNNVEVLKRQLQASQDRFRVGEITRTDVAQSEARLAGSMSARITAEANLAASRATYRRVIGDAPGSLQQPPALPPMPANYDDALSVAFAENPNVFIAKHNEKASRHAVSSAKGSILPSVDAFAYIQRSEGSFGPFAGDRVTDTKAVGAQVRIPLYQSGGEYAEIRRSKHVNSQRRLQIVAAERRVRSDVKTAWEQYRASVASITSSSSQVNANTIALDGVRQEAAVGSRTTLDVLDAEQELLDSRVNLVRAERNQYVAGFSLLGALGRLNAVSLDLDVEVYDPKEYYGDVSWKFLGWGVK